MHATCSSNNNCNTTTVSTYRTDRQRNSDVLLPAAVKENELFPALKHFWLQCQKEEKAEKICKNMQHFCWRRYKFKCNRIKSAPNKRKDTFWERISGLSVIYVAHFMGRDGLWTWTCPEQTCVLQWKSMYLKQRSSTVTFILFHNILIIWNQFEFSQWKMRTEEHTYIYMYIYIYQFSRMMLTRAGKQTRNCMQIRQSKTKLVVDSNCFLFVCI